ncbi:hypothetical protein [Nocardia sp. NPDC020380]|uniref:hypothetical protein n=1 Tax=Nocardia sp. NPDC020380 TaxID=3364309 RepID=UPI0037B488C3
MKRTVIGHVLAAVAAGVMVTASVAGTAAAEVVTPMHRSDGSDWRDPGAPPGTDRHCDHRGFWHNDDQWGHPDGRCHPW